MLSWTDLEIGHGAQALNYPFSGSISEPGIYIISGQNGCGKSTLLKTWLGLVRPKAGSVVLSVPQARKNASKDTVQGAAGMAGVAYVPQCHAVNSFFHISVFDFVKQGFGPSHHVTADDKRFIEEQLANWQLAGYAQKSFHQLSGGQKIRCMLVRAILSNATIWFLDEPLSHLDFCCQQLLMDTLENFVKTRGVCVVMIDHHFERYEHLVSARFIFQKSHDDPLSHIYYVKSNAAPTG